MLTEVLLGILLVALLFAFVNRKPPNLPPGKWGWPVVGCLPSDDVSLGEQVMELRKKHGDIISWRMGSRIFIFFCDPKIIKAAFSKMEFSDRPDFYSFDVFSNFIKAGLSNINGQLWVNNRTFALRHLKQLGMGKSYLEEAVQYEAACMVKDFKKHTNKVGRLPWSLSVAILNVIWQMAANQRFDVDDPEMQRFSKVIRSLFDDFQGPVVWFDLMPWLIPITPTFVKRWMGIEQLQEKLQEIFEYMDNSIKEHQAKLDPQNPKDYIDAYLLEMEEQKNNPESTMNLFDLKICMVDLFTAGSETTSATIRWALFLLAKHPEMQAKVQKEIDSVFPRDVLPSVQQRNSLPYLEAISLEVHRYASIARLGFLHYCNKDTEFMGYTIPKGAVLSQHHECCHTDPAYWEKPNEFYPEHFLDAEGNLLTKKEGFMPFSLGRRQCPGEPLVRMELFVFLSALLQNFVFSVPKGVELLLEKNAHDSFLNMPKDLEIMITERP